MVCVLALDLSSHTGAAHDGPTPGVPLFQTKHLASAMDGEYGAQGAEARKFINELIMVVRPDLIVYEAPLVLADSKGRTKVDTKETVWRQQMGLSYLVEVCAAEAGIECVKENNQSIKKYLAGTGHATKQAMIMACHRFGWMVADDNQADACGLWSLTKSLHDPSFAPLATPLFRSAAR